MDEKERAALENMVAKRQVRDTHQPGTKEYKAADLEFRKAEAEYYKARE